MITHIDNHSAIQSLQKTYIVPNNSRIIKKMLTVLFKKGYITRAYKLPYVSGYTMVGKSITKTSYQYLQLFVHDNCLESTESLIHQFLGNDIIALGTMPG